MKFISFNLQGSSRFGVTDENTITDLTDKVLGARTLKDLISKNAIPQAKKYALENP